MSLCVSVSEWGALEAVPTAVAQCSSYVLISASEHLQNNEPILFNSELFLYITGALLVNMVVGHTTGRIVRMLSKR